MDRVKSGNLSLNPVKDYLRFEHNMGYERITKNDPEVKRLLHDPNLRKIFHGIDYSPLNVQ